MIIKNKIEYLKTENRRLESIMDLADMGWWIADLKKRIYHFSDSVQRILDLPSNQIPFTQYRDLIREDYRLRITEEFTNEDFSNNGFAVRSFTYPFSTKSGMVWVSAKYKIEDFDGDSTIFGYIQRVESPENSDMGLETVHKLNNLIYQQKSISKTLQSILSDEDMTEVINDILSELLAQFNAQRAYMMEFNHVKRTQDCVYEVCSRDELREIDNLKDIPFEFVQWWMDHMFANKPVIINNLDEIPPEGKNVRDILEPQNIKSLMVVPLVINDLLWGYAGIDMVDSHRTWSKEDYEWFSSLINITGICMELRRSEQKAQNLDKLKSVFLANMSHEIRTPLNAILGFTRLMADSDDTDERKLYFNIVQNNNDLLLQLISDILDLSKIEAGTLDFNREIVDVHTLCKEIRISYLVKDTRGNVIEFDEDSPTYYVTADRFRLIQVISNFVNNAVKFTDKGIITMSYELADENHLKISVTDTGIGIAADKKDLVFNRFVKLNDFKQGTGLGLAICRSIIEQLGGTIGVESEEGKGSTFWFTLPYDKTVHPETTKEL